MADTDARARLFLELVSTGVADASKSMHLLAGHTQQAAVSWQRVAAGWKDVRSGEFLKRAQEFAAVGKEQEKLAQKQRELNIIAREGSFVGGLKVMQDRLAGVGRIGAWGFGLITAGVGSWIRSGMQGTAEAQRLSHAMSLISREIANAFAPWIQRLVEGISQLAAKFRSLTGEQQESARRWIALGLGVTGFMALLPRLIGGLAAVTKAFQAMGLARAAALAGPVGLAVAAAGIALSATPEGRDTLAALFKAVEPLITVFGRLASEISQAVLPILKAFADTIGSIVSWVVETHPGLAKGGQRRLPSPVEEPGGFSKALFPKLAGLGTGGGLIAGLLGVDVEGFFRRLIGLSDNVNAAAGDRAKTGLTAAGSGFERPEDLWRRLQTAVAKTGISTPEERTAKATETAAELLRKMAGAASTSATEAIAGATAGERGLAGAGS